MKPRGRFSDWFPWALDICDSEAKPRRCGAISFSPNTEYGTSRITAFDINCKAARNVARASRPIRVKPRYARYRYRARGFTCTGYSLEADGLPTIYWTCVGNTAVVTVERS